MSTATRVSLSFEQISARLHQTPIPPVDLVVGIGRGGVVLAAMVAHQLRVGLEVISLNYRDDANRPRHPGPQLLQPLSFDPAGLNILLVDDVCVTGATLERARALLQGAQITTLTAKGKADLVLFPEVGSCVNWPWSQSRLME